VLKTADTFDNLNNVTKDLNLRKNSQPTNAENKKQVRTLARALSKQ
jgi:hypothetical protein